MEMLGIMRAKRSFTFFAATLCPITNRSRATDGQMLCFSAHLRQFFTFLHPSTRYPRYATAGFEQKVKKFDVIIFVSPPPTFSIVLRHWLYSLSNVLVKAIV